MLLPICFCGKRHEPMYKRSVVSLHTVFQKSISVHLRSLLWFTLVSRPDFLSLSFFFFFLRNADNQHNLSVCLLHKIICNCQSRHLNFLTSRYLSRNSALKKKMWVVERGEMNLTDFTFLTIYTIKMTEFSGGSRHRKKENPASCLQFETPGINLH